MRVPVTVVGMVAAIGLVIAAPLSAEEPVDGDVAKRREYLARTVFEDANRFLAEGKYQEALDRYEIAYELWPRPKILLNMATLLLELGREVDAANAFARYLAGGEIEVDRAAKVHEILAELDRKLARVYVRERDSAPGGRLRIDGQAISGARITRRTSSTRPGSQEATDTTDVVVRVAPGTHAIALEHPDSPAGLHVVTVAAGQEVDVPAGQALASTRSSASELRPRALLYLRGDFDTRHSEFVAAPGLALRLVGDLAAYGNAILGEHPGGELGLRFEPRWGAIRLRASASAPVIDADGLAVSGRVAAGLSWSVGWRLRGALEMGLLHRVTGPENVARSTFLVAVSAEMAL